MNVIETHHLNFSYGKKQILNDLNLQIPQGSIYGLLGRNGAGKSTTLKILLGLLPYRKESVSYWGSTQYDQSRFFRIGNLIESPALYNYMTVEEHLKMYDILFQKGEERIREVLELTGLTQERKKKAGKLSTGLKQRLGLALAIFRNPDVLILDEPTNGLDLLGIMDVREMLLKLQQQGKTIVLSSHILPEIEKLCTHVGIIEYGTLQYQGEIGKIGAGSLEDFYHAILKNNLNLPTSC